MARIISFDDGEVLDIDSSEGAFRYVSRFLREYGAPGGVFQALGTLHRVNVKIKRAGLVSSPDWGDCDNCGVTITINANFCPGCGGIVVR